MCLSVTVTLLGEYQKSAKEIAESASIEDGLAVWHEKRWFRQAPRYLFISDGRNSCSCGLLSDAADWNVETWDMDSSYLPRIAATLKKLHELMPKGFYLEALWGGDKPENEMKVAISELVDIVEHSRLGTKTRYLVTAA